MQCASFEATIMPASILGWCCYPGRSAVCVLASEDGRRSIISTLESLRLIHSQIMAANQSSAADFSRTRPPTVWEYQCLTSGFAEPGGLMTCLYVMFCPVRTNKPVYSASISAYLAIFCNSPYSRAGLSSQCLAAGWVCESNAILLGSELV